MHARGMYTYVSVTHIIQQSNDACGVHLIPQSACMCKLTKYTFQPSNIIWLGSYFLYIC